MPQNLNPNWFDFFFLGVIAVGIMRGRKRGISEELLDVFQWLLIVVVAALVYKPAGKFFADFTHMDLLYGYVSVYILTGLLVKVLFTAIKRMVGEKLIQSDAFGGLEYYLGMIAGALRFFCIMIVALALLHAKYISAQERAATAKVQQDSFGNISFPTIGSLQQTVFYESVSGQFIKKNLSGQLIDAAPPGVRQTETLGRKRERAVDEVGR
jgi:uncharacterized membrane protein required for colicin V production